MENIKNYCVVESDEQLFIEGYTGGNSGILFIGTYKECKRYLNKIY